MQRRLPFRADLEILTSDRAQISKRRSSLEINNQDLERGPDSRKSHHQSYRISFKIASPKREESFTSRFEESMESFRRGAMSARVTSNQNTLFTQTHSPIKRFAAKGYEMIESYIVNLTEYEEKHEPHHRRFPSKKWVVSEIHKLGFTENQIHEAMRYMNNFSPDSKKEDMLKLTVNHLISKQKGDEEVEVVEKTNRYRANDDDTGQMSLISFRSIAKSETNIEGNTGDDSRKIIIEDDPETKTESTKDKVDEKVRKNTDTTITESIVCEICFEGFSSKSMKPILDCGHIFCWSCYREYLDEKVHTNKVLNIKCPKAGCNAIFDDNHLNKILNYYYFKKYIRLKEAALLAQNPNLRWCIRPGCAKYTIASPNAKKVVCECGMQICFKCSNAYHPFRSCESVVDKVYKKYAKANNVQCCPQCQFRIEKNGGCDHITCTKCAYEWCWLCGAKYQEGHLIVGHPSQCPKLFEEVTKPLNKQPPSYLSKFYKNPSLILLFPIVLIFFAVSLPYWVHRFVTGKKSETSDIPRSTKISRAAFFGLLGIIFFPLNIIFVFGYLIYEVIRDTCKWIYRKKGKNKEQISKK